MAAAKYTWFIYALRQSADGPVEYVGYTKDRKRRLIEHRGVLDFEPIMAMAGQRRFWASLTPETRAEYLTRRTAAIMSAKRAKKALSAPRAEVQA